MVELVQSLGKVDSRADPNELRKLQLIVTLDAFVGKRWSWNSKWLRRNFCPPRVLNHLPADGFRHAGSKLVLGFFMPYTYVNTVLRKS